MSAAANRSGAPRRLGEPGAPPKQFTQAYVKPDSEQIENSLLRTDRIFRPVKVLGVIINLIAILWITIQLVLGTIYADGMGLGVLAGVMAVLLGSSWLVWKTYDMIWSSIRRRVALRYRYTTVSAADFRAEVTRLSRLQNAYH